MSQRESFLHAICEHPDDDAVRLVYADWLDEHDIDLPRAEFIRVQCALAKTDEDDPRWLPLARREAALLAPHLDEWQQEVPAWARQGCRFRRGFVSQIEV